MKNPDTVSPCRRLRAAVLLVVCCMLITMIFPACSSLPAGYGSLSAQEAAALYDSDIEQLRADLVSSLPAKYTASLPSSELAAASGSDVQTIYAQAQSIKLELLRTAALGILDDQCAYAAELAGENNKTAAEQSASLLRSEVSSAADIDALYELLIASEQRLFGSLAVGISTANEPSMTVLPVLYRDAQQQIWLRMYTNFTLPGFSDSQYGYSLQLLLDNGKTAQASADSIYNSGSIAYDGAYCVRFNLTQMLSSTGVSADEFFSGRNRVAFTLFSIDNSFSLYRDFYRMSDDSMTDTNSGEALLLLACIAAEHTTLPV